MIQNTYLRKPISTILMTLDILLAITASFYVLGGRDPIDQKNKSAKKNTNARFPQFRSRSGKEDTLTDRVNDCLERSLSRRRPPEKSPERTEIVPYMTCLSKDYFPHQNRPDLKNKLKD